MINTWLNVYSISIEIYLILCVCFLLVYGVFFANSIFIGFPILNWNVGWLVFQVLIFGIILLFTQTHIFLLSWNGFLVTDLLAFNTKFLILISSFFWVVLVLYYVNYEKLNSFEYWILALLAVSAMLLVVQSVDLLSIYLTIEFQSLVFYILASFKRNSEFSTEAGLKYFILGAFSSALLLFGSSILYSLTGLTNLNDFTQFFYDVINNDLSFTLFAGIGFCFIITALLFKMSAAPFHMWSPDVYEGAPTSVTALFSILPKIAVTVLLLRLVLYSFHDFIFFWRNLILICGVYSLLVGSLSAFYQVKWKRFFAYSSITHIGFILISIVTGTPDTIVNVFFYLIVYIITMIGIFSFIISLRFFKYPVHSQTRYLKDLIYLGKTNPILALSLTLFLFSMTGIPPLAGFFAKFFILFTALQSYSIGLSIFMILISSISCFYYIRLIKDMYFVKTMDWSLNYPINKAISLTLGFSCICVIFLLLDLENLSNFAVSMSLTT